MTQEAAEREGLRGFEGAIVGLPLADLVQLKAGNRFTGAIAVEFARRKGTIFFRDGEIIHAEKGDLSGEEAFYQILRWPAGRFSVLPRVTTTSHTIDRSWRFLLLEAHRLIDENPIPVVAPPAPKETSARPEARKSATLTERLMAVPGVTSALLMERDGTPVGAFGLEAEDLAARGLYLMLLANRLGGRLGFANATSAVQEGSEGHLFVYEGKRRYLAVAAEGGCRPAETEEVIRGAVGGGRGEG